MSGKLGFRKSEGEGDGDERSVCPPLEFRNPVFYVGSPLRHISSHKYLQTSARVSSFRDRVKKLGCIIRIPGKGGGGGGGGIRFHPCLPACLPAASFLPSSIVLSLPVAYRALRGSMDPRHTARNIYGITWRSLNSKAAVCPTSYRRVCFLGGFSAPQGVPRSFFLPSPHLLSASMRFLLLSLCPSVFSPFSLNRNRILMELPVPVTTFRASVFLARLWMEKRGKRKKGGGFRDDSPLC